MDQKITLKTPVRYLKGVGPERHKVLARLGLHTMGDLFTFFPRRYENRSPIKSIPELTVGEKECVRGVVASRGLIRTRHGQTIFRLVLSDGGANLFASWFNQPYLSKVFLPKSAVILYGRVEREGRHFQMVHPEYEIAAAGGQTVHSGRIVPIYPLTEDLSQKGIRQLLFRLTQDLMHLVSDPLSGPRKRAADLLDSFSAFRNIHFPDSLESLEKATRRLVFDEFLMMQLVVQIKKQKLQKENSALSHRGGEEEVERMTGALGFELTNGQSEAVQDVLRDMKSGRPMHRLVQGDVGSGKTIVAAAGLVFTAANGFQGALMAPTEVLAQQHYFTLVQLLEPLGISCGYLAQGLTAQEKARILRETVSGALQVIVGTHALIQQNVSFKKLGLVVIDEQHKFGVAQRAALKEKRAGSAHLLLMTATPIPRTLALTLYGDLDISTIKELPKGRQPVKTLWVGNDRRGEICAFLDAQIEKGRQGIVICPLISEGKTLSAKGVLSAHAELSKLFSHRRVGLLHGKMRSAEKKRVMQDFKEGRSELLVSTVVIEVGVDVPNATVIVVENAEKFGLAQLHQLRGRVGRGSEESFCILFSDAAGDETAERLGAFERTQSGFEIAEKDLDLRGAGDVVGEKQHGLPDLRIGDLVRDAAILELARNEARRIAGSDPDLALPENRPLKRALEARFSQPEEKLAVLA
ncbi:MAG: ATP-dependent DNA helicase RecG [Candidatus Omnitrophota bacterium]